MTHNKLRDLIDKYDAAGMVKEPAVAALRAVVELHKPELMISSSYCVACTINLETVIYPCPTIRVIEKELQCQ